MPSIKIHGGTKVSSVRTSIASQLGVPVVILKPDGDPAEDGATISSIRATAGATGEFLVPKANVQVGNMENSFADHFGFRIDLLLPDGSLASDTDTLGTIQRLHQRNRADLPPLAEWLRDAREQKKMSLADIAAASGLSEITLRNIQLGETLNPQKQTVQKIEQALGVQVPVEITEEVEAEATIAGVGELIDFDPYVKSDMPNEPGIYVLYDLTDRPIYVGKSEASIRSRILSGHSDKKWFIRPFVQKAAYVKIEDKDLLAKVERLLIRFLKSNALLNTQHVDRSSK